MDGPSTGDRIGGRFILGAPLPDFGLGECFVATDPMRPDAPVQLAFLGPAVPGSACSRERFDAVIATLRPMSNPGILGVLGGLEDRGRLVAITERFEGRSLAHWLAGHRDAGTRPGHTTAQRLFDRVCSAVQVAHGIVPQAVLHRALSPRSVMVRRVGGGQHHVKVGDFGLAPFSLGARAGSIGAWWEYQAPEQHGGRWTDGPPADVFALAVMLVELLSSTPLPRPEGRETWWQFVKESRGAVLDRLVRLDATVPRGVWEVVAQALNPSPKERIASVQRLQRALREAWQAAGEWQTGAETEAEPPTPQGFTSAAVRGAVQGARPSVEAIEGWRSPERAQPAPTTSPTPSVAVQGVDPARAPGLVPPRVAPVFAPATVPMPAMNPMAAPLPDMPFMTPSEHTQALDLSAVSASAFTAPAVVDDIRATMQQPRYAAPRPLLDVDRGTEVMSAPLAASVAAEAFDDVPAPDPANATRAMDTSAAFVVRDLYARELHSDVVATMKPAPRTAPRPVAPMVTGHGAAGDPFAPGPAGDPSPPLAPPHEPTASGSMPPVDPTMAVSIDPSMLGAGGYGATLPVRGLASSVPHPPRSTFAPPPTSHAPPAPSGATLLGQPAWLVVTLGVLVAISVAAGAFLATRG